MNDDEPLMTDNGNHIIDAHTGATIDDPVETERRLLNIAGVVQVGLFNDMCSVVILASNNGVQVLTKED